MFFSFSFLHSSDISCETVNPPICAHHKTNIGIVGHFKECLLKKSALINIYFYLQRDLEDPLYQNIGHGSQRIPMMYCKLRYRYISVRLPGILNLRDCKALIISINFYYGNV